MGYAAKKKGRSRAHIYHEDIVISPTNHAVPRRSV
jgi:hypothetical protein